MKTSSPETPTTTDRCQSPLTYRGVDVGLELTAEDVIAARDHYADTDRRWREQKKTGRPT